MLLSLVGIVVSLSPLFRKAIRHRVVSAADMAEDYVAKLIAQSFGRVDVQHKVGVDYLLCPTHGPDDDLAVPKDFEIGNTVTVAIS